VRQARLNLSRSYLVLRDQELKTQRFLMQQYRRVLEFHNQIEIQRSQRLAAAEFLEGRYRQYVTAPMTTQSTLDILLEATRVWSNALQAEYQAIAQYNSALAAFEFAKGTILQYDNVTIGEGPLPKCAMERAVEHERQRSKALILRERAKPIPIPDGGCEKGCVMPQLPVYEGAPLGAVDVSSMLQPHDSRSSSLQAPTTPDGQTVPQPFNPPPNVQPLSGSLNSVSMPSLAMPPRDLEKGNPLSQPGSPKSPTLPFTMPAASTTSTPMLPEDGWKKAP
jgi:hypothetical protein